MNEEILMYNQANELTIEEEILEEIKYIESRLEIRKIVLKMIQEKPELIKFMKLLRGSE